MQGSDETLIEVILHEQERQVHEVYERAPDVVLDERLELVAREVVLRVDDRHA